MFRNNEKIYKYPLHEVIEVKNLRELADYAAKTYADETAYLIKDPIALREIDYNSAEAKNTKVNPKDEYRKITFTQFAKDRHALGSALKAKLNLQPNDKVVILAETRYEWYLSYLATVCGLSVISPMDKDLPANELSNLLQRSKANTIFFSKGQANKLLEIKDELQYIEHLISYDILDEEILHELSSINNNLTYKYFWKLLDEGQLIRESGDLSYDKLPIDNDALSILIFTSGTTSKSKAVMLSHKNITSNVVDTSRQLYFDHNDTTLSILPLHHTFEATAGFLLAHYRGITIAVNDGLRHISSNLAQGGVTALVVVPLILENIHKKIFKNIHSDEKLEKKFDMAIKFSRFLRKIGIDVRKKLFKQIHESLGGKIRLIICGGAALDPQIARDLDDLGFNCIQGYGLTECSPIMAVNRSEYSDPASVGLPIISAEIKIIDKDENGIGEIIGRGPYIMLGYYEDPERTAEAIDKEGFYHTGDYGYIDEHGFVYITGRKANIIVTKNGKNIFPEEIESLIQQEPIIGEVIVFGQADENGEQIITAEILADQEYLQTNPDLRNETLTSEKVLAAVKEAVNRANLTLNPFKRIKEVILRAEPFPRNTSRKILRNKVEKR